MTRAGRSDSRRHSPAPPHGLTASFNHLPPTALDVNGSDRNRAVAGKGRGGRGGRVAVEGKGEGEGGGEGDGEGGGEGVDEGEDEDEDEDQRNLEKLRSQVQGEVTVEKPAPGFHQPEDFGFHHIKKYHAKLLYDFSEHSEEFGDHEVKTGDEVVVLETNDEGWCNVKNSEGYKIMVPQNYLKHVKNYQLPNNLHHEFSVKAPTADDFASQAQAKGGATQHGSGDGGGARGAAKAKPDEEPAGEE